MVKKCIIPFLAAACLALVVSGCQKELDPTPHPEPDPTSKPFRITIVNKAGTSDLVLNSTYTNVFGEEIKITNFKYYISNIGLLNADLSVVEIPNTYFLVNQRDDASLVINVSTQGSTYSGIKFLVGVDSAHNVSGPQTGALDPANGMFWTWNSGYIMAKLEGTSPASKEPLSAVTYHIGGFRTGENTVRELKLLFPQSLQLNKDAVCEVVLNADALKWFEGDHLMKIADHAYCTTPGELAVKFADNYATMFSVEKVINR